MSDFLSFFGRLPSEGPPQPETPGKRPTLHLKPNKPIEPEKTQSTQSPVLGETAGSPPVHPSGATADLSEKALEPAVVIAGAVPEQTPEEPVL